MHVQKMQRSLLPTTLPKSSSNSPHTHQKPRQHVVCQAASAATAKKPKQGTERTKLGDSGESIASKLRASRVTSILAMYRLCSKALMRHAAFLWRFATITCQNPRDYFLNVNSSVDLWLHCRCGSRQALHWCLVLEWQVNYFCCISHYFLPCLALQSQNSHYHHKMEQLDLPNLCVSRTMQVDYDLLGEEKTISQTLSAGHDIGAKKSTAIMETMQKGTSGTAWLNKLPPCLAWCCPTSCDLVQLERWVTKGGADCSKYTKARTNASFSNV